MQPEVNFVCIATGALQCVITNFAEYVVATEMHGEEGYTLRICRAECGCYVAAGLVTGT